MKFKNLGSLLVVLKRFDEAECSVKAKVQALRILRALKEEMSVYEDMKRKILETCAKKDENGNPIKFINQKQQLEYKVRDEVEFAEKHEGLLNQEFKIDADQIDLPLGDAFVSGFKLGELDILIEAGLLEDSADE